MLIISTATISHLNYSANIIISIAPPQLFFSFMNYAYSNGCFPNIASLKVYWSLITTFDITFLS